MNSSLFQVDRVQLIHNDSPLRAFVSIKMAEAFIVQNLKVIEGSKGLFVSMPQEKGTDKEGEEKYFDVAFPTKKEHREEICKLVLEAYQAKVNNPAKD